MIWRIWLDKYLHIVNICPTISASYKAVVPTDTQCRLMLFFGLKVLDKLEAYVIISFSNPFFYLISSSFCRSLFV